MTIAGSDSGGGAGLQADLKTFCALGVFGTSVVTAVTAQNTSTVLGVSVMSPQMVDMQIEAVLSDLPVAAVKTGMLADAWIIGVVAERASSGDLPALVVDPVLVTSTGQALLDDEGVRAYLEMLLPHAWVLTPNVREAAVLLGLPHDALRGVEDTTEAARELTRLGARNALVKGGHLSGERSPDVLVGADAGPTGVAVFDGPRVSSSNDHGSGCTLSAALAALLARESVDEVADLVDVVRRAKEFVTDALRGSATWKLGAGHGPLDHFGWGAARHRPAGRATPT
jgi:hydroxymethylpyrimidine/phosphomethylpyrimidine kinase